MKWGILLLAAVAGAQSNIDQNFNDSVFLVKPFPGATLVKGSSQRLKIDPAYGWAKSFQLTMPGYGRAYRTNDMLEKVRTHYIHEYTKLGKQISHGKQHEFLFFALNSGDRISIRMNAIKTGGTEFEVYRMLPNKAKMKS